MKRLRSARKKRDVQELSDMLLDTIRDDDVNLTEVVLDPAGYR